MVTTLWMAALLLLEWENSNEDECATKPIAALNELSAVIASAIAPAHDLRSSGAGVPGANRSTRTPNYLIVDV